MSATEIIGFSESKEFFKKALTCNGFGVFRINHGYWDSIARARDLNLWPDVALRSLADKSTGWEGLFTSGIIDEVNKALADVSVNHPKYRVYISTGSSPSNLSKKKDDKTLNTIRMFSQIELDPYGASLPKYLVETGEFVSLLEEIGETEILVVGPGSLDFSTWRVGKAKDYISIPERQAFLHFTKIVKKIECKLEQNPNIRLVIFQASVISLVVAHKLRERFPRVSWVDMGLALSAFQPDSLIGFPWFQKKFKEILKCHELLIQRELLMPRVEVNQTKSESSETFQKALKLLKLLSNSDKEAVTCDVDEIDEMMTELRSEFCFLPSLRLRVLASLPKFDSNKDYLIDQLEKEFDTRNLFPFGAKLLMMKLLSREKRIANLEVLFGEIEKEGIWDQSPRIYLAKAYLGAKSFDKAKSLMRDMPQDLLYPHSRSIERIIERLT